MLTFFVTQVASVSSVRRAKHERQVERDIAREMKLVEFRQSWINALRDDLSEFSSLCGNACYRELDSENYLLLGKVSERISLRLNPSDKSYSRLHNCKSEILMAAAKKKIDSNAKEEFTSISQSILKGEWDRIKRDLGAATSGDVKKL